MATVGTVIGGQYEILKQIGHGGMSTVYLGMGKRLGKNWAIKEAKKGDSNSNSARFFEATPIEEANFLKDLHHKNIVSVTDIIEQGGYTYIVEEYLPGQDLEDKMKAGPSPVKDVVHWGEQICDALDYLHQRNIIYRDMKPANVRLDAEGDRVILMDFGIAKRYDPAHPADKYKVGTKGYAPQEQFQGMTDQRSDIYALGITLKALLLGISPYEPAFNDPRSASRIQGENGDGLLRVLNKAINPDPAKRYQTAAAFGKAIKNYEQISSRYKAKLKKQRNTFFGFAIATVVTLVIALVFTGMMISTKNKPVDEMRKAESFTQIQTAFGDIFVDSKDENGTDQKEARIPYDESTKDAAVKIVDIFVDGKDNNISDFEKCLKLYKNWAQPSDISSENDYLALIKNIYETKDIKEEDKEKENKELDRALFLYICRKSEEKNYDKKEIESLINKANELITGSDKDIKEFLSKSKNNLSIINKKGINISRDKEEYESLEAFKTYLTDLQGNNFYNNYKDVGFKGVIESLLTRCEVKIKDMDPENTLKNKAR